MRSNKMDHAIYARPDRRLLVISATGEVPGYVLPLFENMGRVICPNLHRNIMGSGGR